MILSAFAMLSSVSPLLHGQDVPENIEPNLEVSRSSDDQ